MVGKISKPVCTRICHGLCRQGPDSQDLGDSIEEIFFREFGLIVVVPHKHTPQNSLHLIFFCLALSILLTKIHTKG